MLNFNLFKFSKIEIPSILLTLIIAIYFTFVVNVVLALKIFDIIENLEHVKLGFVLSMPVFFILAFNVIFTLFSIKYFEKIFFIFILLVSSLVSYTMYAYGVIFDHNMIDNIFQTDIGEAGSYLNLTSAIWFISMGLIPSIFIFYTKITHTSLGKEILYKLGSIAFSLSIIGIIAVFYYVDYAAVVRNNSSIRKTIVPTYYLTSTVKSIKYNYFTPPIEYRFIGLDAKKIIKQEVGKNKLMVLVVGETARAMNYQLNGYSKPTNAYTKDMGVFSFKNVVSCGTATAISVPCMFSKLKRVNYSKKMADSQDDLLDVVKRSGVNILWLENNSSCKGVCKNIETIDLRKYGIDKDKYCDGSVCLDEIFLPNIKDRIKKANRSKDNLIVLHIMGSHGPTYYKRYTKDEAKFKPDCPKSDIQNCTAEEIVNTYDNTILHTDYIISEIIKILESHEDEWDTSMVYMSDHGESLGEKGLYLHGMPYAIAPKEQTHIPYITWFSKGFKQDYGFDDKCIENIANTGNYSHDNLFYTVIGLMGISTNAYDANMDIFQKCYKPI